MQARVGASAPAQAAAACAQAARPAQRVAFKAACRVVAPHPLQNAKANAPAQWRAHKPAWETRRNDSHLPLEVCLIIKVLLANKAT